MPTTALWVTTTPVCVAMATLHRMEDGGKGKRLLQKRTSMAFRVRFAALDRQRMAHGGRNVHETGRGVMRDRHLLRRRVRGDGLSQPSVRWNRLSDALHARRTPCFCPVKPSTYGSKQSPASSDRSTCREGRLWHNHS